MSRSDIAELVRVWLEESGDPQYEAAFELAGLYCDEFKAKETQLKLYILERCDNDPAYAWHSCLAAGESVADCTHHAGVDPADVVSVDCIGIANTDPEVGVVINAGIIVSQKL